MRKHVRSVDRSQPLAQISVEDLAKVSAGAGPCVTHMFNATITCRSYNN
jgi:hypothetical protein